MSLRHQTAAVGATLLAACLAFPPGAGAFQASGLPVVSAEAPAGALAFSVEGSLGSLSGKAYERVYAGSFKLSQLDWEIKEVATAGVQGSAVFAGRFSVNLGLWAALTEGNGTMIDRDWLYMPPYPGGLPAPPSVKDEDWTHESRHPDTSLDEATLVDLNLAWRALDFGGAGLSAILGYKSQKFAWTARGGTFVYSDLDTGGFRNRRAVFPDRPVIVYEQQYTVPYIGVALDGTWGAFSLEGHLALSTSASATDTDDHVLRSTVFKGDFSGGEYAELGVKGTYFFTPRIFASVALEAQAFDEMVGDVEIRSPDGYGVSRDGGAVEIATALLTIGGGIRF